MQWELRIKESSLDRSPSALLLHAERTMAFGIKEKIFSARIKVRDPIHTYMCNSERELVCCRGMVHCGQAPNTIATWPSYHTYNMRELNSLLTFQPSTVPEGGGVGAHKHLFARRSSVSHKTSLAAHSHTI